MKPSDISLDHPIPLTGVFGRVENELAAALMIFTLQNRDSWGALQPCQIGATCKGERFKTMPWHNIPLITPDFFGLVKAGFAEFTSDEKGAPIQFTEKGLEKLKASIWCRKEVRS